MTRATTSEIMLALRSPDAGWLGVLACVIDEASRDPQFDDRQRRLAAQMLADGALPTPLVRAAQERAACFEAELDQAIELEAPATAAARPKLTLVGH